MSDIFKKIKISWTYPTQPTSLQIGTVKIYRGTSEFTLDNVLSQVEIVSQEYDPTFTSFTDDFELEYDITYYYMIVVYGDIDSSISAATELYSIKIETSQDTIPSNEMHFTTTTGSLSYTGNSGDVITLSDGTTYPVSEDGNYSDENVPAGKHKIILTETREHGYVGVDGEALVELHNFPTLSAITSFDFCPNSSSPNLVKVPTLLPSNLTDIGGMFVDATAFNQDISSWNVSNVTNMHDMFYGAISFNQDISNWDVSSVTDMNYMFYEARDFNQPLNDWNVSNVTNMSIMFYGAISFNQDVGMWNVSNVTGMDDMFGNAIEFNQDLSQWCVPNITQEPINFSLNSPLTSEHKPVWGTCPNG